MQPDTPGPSESRLAPPTQPMQPAMLTRRELFCQHMAAGAGGADAARRAGYSPAGAKQRASLLMRQPKVRLRIDALRAGRRAEQQRDLNEAVDVVDEIIDLALDQSKGALALRALDYKLKLKGVIQDKRIDFHANNKPSPDADLENAPEPPDQDLDGLPDHVVVAILHNLDKTGTSEAPAPAPVPEPALILAQEAEIVTFDDPDADNSEDDFDDLCAADPDAVADAIHAITARGAIHIPAIPALSARTRKAEAGTQPSLWQIDRPEHFHIPRL